jgi:hypothetical protein
MQRFISVIALIGLCGLSSLATAGLITRQFEFSSTAGPLLFGPNIGSFTYDDSIVPAGGGQVDQLGLFIDLDVSFAGFSFDETAANSGWLTFDIDGDLLEAHFGNNCGAGYCVIYFGQPQWWIRVGEPPYILNDFTYTGFAGVNDTFYSSNENRLLPIPLPTTLLLLGAGLCLLLASSPALALRAN